MGTLIVTNVVITVQASKLPTLNLRQEHLPNMIMVNHVHIKMTTIVVQTATNVISLGHPSIQINGYLQTLNAGANKVDLLSLIDIKIIQFKIIFQK